MPVRAIRRCDRCKSRPIVVGNEPLLRDTQPTFQQRPKEVEKKHAKIAKKKEYTCHGNKVGYDGLDAIRSVFLQIWGKIESGLRKLRVELNCQNVKLGS